MLKSRWLSTFTVIGVVLIVLGIVGLVLGPRFIYDPGQPVTGKEPWCYLAIGVLMVLNGMLTPPPVEPNAPPAVGGNGRHPASRASGGRAVAASTTDKSE
jgi:hypothetical protein